MRLSGDFFGCKIKSFPWWNIQQYNSIKNKASGISFLVSEVKAIECRHKSSQSRAHETLFPQAYSSSPHIFFTKWNFVVTFLR